MHTYMQWANIDIYLKLDHSYRRKYLKQNYKEDRVFIIIIVRF